MVKPEINNLRPRLLRIAVATAYVLLTFSFVSSIGFSIGRFSAERSVFDHAPVSQTFVDLGPLLISKTIPAGIGLWLLFRRYNYARGLVPAILGWLYVQRPASIIVDWIWNGSTPYWATNQQAFVSFFFFSFLGICAVLFVAHVFVRRPEALEHFRKE